MKRVEQGAIIKVMKENRFEQLIFGLISNQSNRNLISPEGINSVFQLTNNIIQTTENYTTFIQATFDVIF